MRRLVDAGVPSGVFLAPILPGITGLEDSIEAVVSSAREYGARHVWASTLRLAPLVKEHYLGFVGETYPDLIPRYVRAYASANAPAPYRSRSNPGSSASARGTDSAGMHRASDRSPVRHLPSNRRQPAIGRWR